MMLSKICSLTILLITALVIAVTGCATGPVGNEQQLQSSADDMQKAIQAKLTELDHGLAEAAVKMAKTGLTGDGAREILEGLCVRYPYLVDTAAQDIRGTMVTLAPASARQYEGTNTSKNEVSTEFFANKEPLLSNMFRAAQGYDALVLVRPIFLSDGKILGSVSGLFRPESFLEEIVAPQSKSSGLKVYVMQLDGIVMYCTTLPETGKNLLTDPSYKDCPELIEQAGKIVAQKKGTGAYVCRDAGGKTVKKTVYWTSVGLHGNEWRLATIAELGN